jgi:pyruvate/2-oxoglutarate dehydrogenase complex dihydrolipoamide acyltransferase (E2) component
MASAFPRARRHTLYFLREALAVRSVFLDADIDMDKVIQARERLRGPGGVHISVLCFLIYVISRIFASCPEVNIGVSGAILGRQRQYKSVHTKILADKTLFNTRTVVSSVIRDANNLDLQELATALENIKKADVETAPEFANLRLVQSLPSWLGWIVYRLAVRSLDRRHEIHGSFAITSLGHRSIRGFYPISGSSFTFGVGRIAEAPVVHDGAIVIRPMLRLCLAFDHRAVDGGLSSDLMEKIKVGLENFQYE